MTNVKDVFSILRSRDFRLLWLGQSASVIGDGLIIVAIGLFVTRLTGDPRDVGVVLAAYVLPLVLFLLVGGVIADRLPRQAVMVATDVIRALLHGTLALLIALGVVQIWHMVVIGLLFGTSQAFFQPAYTGLVPQTVPEDGIQQAQALNGVSRELAAFVSPALATALVLSVGGAVAFALDAVTFAISAATLSRVRARSRGEAAVRSTLLGELREGWTAVQERSWVWATIAAFATALLVALAPFFVLGPAVSRQVYGTEAVFGITNAFWGVGTVTGALIGARWRPRRPLLTGLLVSLVWPGQIALFAAGPSTALLYPVTALAGLGLGLFGVWWETALAERIPAHLLSRVSAWDWMGSLVLLPLGYLLAGPVAVVIGEPEVLIGGGLIGMAVMTLALLPRSIWTLTQITSSSQPDAYSISIGSS
ncbi:MAG TPA: MFS transporter [Kineosporiaceae bacterium]|nr:MFS transporter [Kineosporiaceae bacterium]